MVVGISGGVILTNQTFFKAIKQHIVKLLSVGINVKFCMEGNFFLLGGGNLRRSDFNDLNHFS